MRTVPRVKARASVNGGNVTEAGAPGGTEIVCVSTARPSSSSRTGTLLTAADPRLTMLAATVTLSWPEKSDRCGSTVDTVRLAVCASVMGTALNVVPSGSRRFSSRTQPLRWKSLIMMTSRVCSVGIREHALRKLQRRRVAGRLGTDFGGVDGADDAREIRGGAHFGLGVGAEEDQGRVVRGRQPLHRLPRGGLRARPAVAVSHAVRTIEHDDDFTRPGSARERRRSGDRKTGARTRERSAG